MALKLGAKLGPYEIQSAIGAGGMGEVYRALDTNLGRLVAIKILPEAFAHDPERLARFEREAKTLASLNHPNIAQIHGLEKGAGTTALVMELVEGPTLAERIADRPMDFDEALPIAKQIAEALRDAHDRGIVHRDLKPSNIKVRADGTVKVLDFGLAKALEVDPGSTGTSESPTITSPAMTRLGVILGTAAYMSPEQARGHHADKRSDLWAFGCVLYEMLAGTRAFRGEDVADTLAVVLRDEPLWSALPATVPPAIVALMRACLEKNHQRRVGDVSTAQFIFDHAVDVQAPVPARALARAHRTASLLMATGATAVLAACVAWLVKPASVPSQPLARFTIPLPTGVRFSNTGVHAVALSADGRRLVYTANLRLYLRTMDQLDPTPIRGTEGTGAAAGRGPFFSPDGQWIGFWQDGQIKKISTTGGSPVALCAAENPWGASWTSDNTILYGQSVGSGAGIWRVSSEGGKPEHLVKLEAGQVAQGPEMLPGGRAIVFTLARRADLGNTPQIVVQSLDSGTRHVVLERGADARYVPTGHLVYALDGTLLAVPFDLTTLAVRGPALPLLDDVAQQNVTAQFTISSQGALVYVPKDALGGQSPAQRTLVWVDRHGREEPMKTPPRAYVHPRLSPDGTRVALDVRDQEADIWIWDLVRERLTRLTFGPTFEQYGIWTPDGRDVIFSSAQFGGPTAARSLFRRSADGTGTVEQLTQSDFAQFPSSVTPDGTALIFRQHTAPKLGTATGMDLLLLPLQGDRRLRPLVQTPAVELNAEMSSDGRWLAYQSNETGRDEIYVRPFPNVDSGKWLVSTSGGTQPLWARNGRELFFESNGALMRVPLTMGSTFEAGTPAKLIDGPQSYGLPGRMYDVSPDGRRFLMIKEIGGVDEVPPSARLILVQNWTEELKRLVPTK